MQHKFKLRYILMYTLCAIMMVALIVQLYKLQIVEGSTYFELSQNKKTKTIISKGMRGKIMDSNALPLAFDEKSFNIEFYRDPAFKLQSDRENYSKIIHDVINIVESNGGKTIEGFWLKRDEAGQWVFDTGTSNPTSNDKRIKSWRENFSVPYVEVDRLFDTLCKNYGIPDDLTEQQKIKILAIWQESRMNAYVAGMPVVIARNVGLQTVAEIEVRTMDLQGISISESTTRVYPRNSLAAHIIGYTGKMTSDDTITANREKGYSPSDLVGITGIEYTMEDELTPNISYRQGKRIVENTRLGKIVRDIGYQAPIDGNSIMLTIDCKLQKVGESILADTIEKINTEQVGLINSESWREDNKKALEKLGDEYKPKLAETGAFVAINPNNGKLLAAGNYPTFDLNWMVSGENGDDIAALIKDERNPMFNRFISAKDTPGSVFKIVTGLAGLMENVITPETTYSDEGKFKRFDTYHAPSCWIAPSKIGDHADQDIIKAIKNSCNYYFFEVAAKLGSANLNKWAARLGLTSRTGIELPGEALSFVGSQTTLYDSTRAIDDQNTYKPQYSANKIKQLLRSVGEERNIAYDEERLDKVTKLLLDVVVGDMTKEEWVPIIRNILLNDMNLPADYIQSKALGTTIISYLNDLKWTPNETIMSAIGQSITQLTPIAVARYFAAIANGGTVYDIQVIDKIIAPNGEIILEKKPVVASELGDTKDYLDVIKQGMHGVVSLEEGGTAAEGFKNSKYKDVICSKTGTAQGSGDLDIENKSWLVAFAPIDNPQILVVVNIDHGYAGIRSSAVAAELIDYYLDRMSNPVEDMLPLGNSLAP